MVRLTFLGHAAWHVKTDAASFFLDPFITDNPNAPKGALELPADYIFLSHAHFDHAGDAATIAKTQSATVVSTVEVASHIAAQGADKSLGMNLGGTVKFPFGTVKTLQAIHSAGVAGGIACSFLFTVEGKKIYFACDTALYSDMKLLSELWGPVDVAILPIGSHFTMDAADAAAACRLIRPKVVIPDHYNTWEPIQADPQAFKADVESGGDTRVEILSPGQTYDV